MTDRKFLINGIEVQVENIRHQGGDRISFTIHGQSHDFILQEVRGEWHLLKDGESPTLRSLVHIRPSGNGGMVVDASSYSVEIQDVAGVKSAELQTSEGSIKSPLPARVMSCKVKAGETVARGQTLLVLEAMKMEHAIRAERNGIISQLHCKVGDAVAQGDTLIEFAKDSAT